jgi:cyclopropane-fatty-acyl-phospholipid synthase|tara:strand:+ start:247 stop:1290 length:1044 start_codon:yes stop_codon:yes gene_type:complete
MSLNTKIFSLDNFINKALYDPKNGFYMKKNPFGNKGDFITSPNISILFSEMLSIWTVAFWRNLKCPKKINLVELGSGNGQMIYDMINSFKNFPKFYKSCKFIILEKSPYLKKIQKKKLKKFKVKWIKNLNEIQKGNNIFIANEFFDALPIKQFFKINNKWNERFVKSDKKNNKYFINIDSDIKKIEKKVGFKISNNQKIIEYSPVALKYLKNISKKINNKKGALLIIDYGYLEDSMKDTLIAIRKHKIITHFNEFENSDITYNLNFKLLRKITNILKLKCQGITTQRNFLMNLGIQQRAEIISRNLPFSKKADIYYRLKRLVDKNQMGDLFKVMLITNKKINFKLGF